MIVSAAELLKSGETHAALDRLKQEVRKAPREPRLRTFLFQMFCIVGAWDRALTQLAAAAESGAIGSTRDIVRETGHAAGIRGRGAA